MLPKTIDANAKAAEAEREKEKEHSSRLSALSNFSISDVLNFRDGSKNVKFPEKLMRVLEQKLQDIAMGKDARCVASIHAVCE